MYCVPPTRWLEVSPCFMRSCLSSLLCPGCRWRSWSTTSTSLRTRRQTRSVRPRWTRPTPSSSTSSNSSYSCRSSTSNSSTITTTPFCPPPPSECGSEDDWPQGICSESTGLPTSCFFLRFKPVVKVDLFCSSPIGGFWVTPSRLEVKAEVI